MSEPFPTPGIHTGPVPPMAATDPTAILSDHPEIDPGDGCRVCGMTHQHSYGCRLRRPDPAVRVGDTLPESASKHRDANTAPTLGALANYMTLWKERGVTGESVAYAAGQVWPAPADDVALAPMIDGPSGLRVKRERDYILERAGNLISDVRDQEYGSAKENFTAVGRLWAVTFGLDEAISPELVAIALSQLKQARLLTRRNHRDSWDDGTGYMALGGDIAAELEADRRAYEQR